MKAAAKAEMNLLDSEALAKIIISDQGSAVASTELGITSQTLGFNKTTSDMVKGFVSDYATTLREKLFPKQSDFDETMSKIGCQKNAQGEGFNSE